MDGVKEEVSSGWLSLIVVASLSPSSSLKRGRKSVNMNA